MNLALDSLARQCFARNEQDLVDADGDRITVVLGLVDYRRRLEASAPWSGQ